MPKKSPHEDSNQTIIKKEYFIHEIIPKDNKGNR
jgi:hypothetical protein